MNLKRDDPFHDLKHRKRHADRSTTAAQTSLTSIEVLLRLLDLTLLAYLYSRILTSIEPTGLSAVVDSFPSWDVVALALSVYIPLRMILPSLRALQTRREVLEEDYRHASSEGVVLGVFAWNLFIVALAVLLTAAVRSQSLASGAPIVHRALGIGVFFMTAAAPAMLAFAGTLIGLNTALLAERWRAAAPIALPLAVVPFVVVLCVLLPYQWLPALAEWLYVEDYNISLATLMLMTQTLVAAFGLGACLHHANRTGDLLRQR